MILLSSTQRSAAVFQNKEIDMPDQLETELKFIVHDPDGLRGRLLGLGAVLKGRHAEENIRLDDGSRSLTSRKTALRLRRVEQGAETRSILTVKTPGASGGTFKSRREIELEVSDGPAMLTALGVLGFAPYMRYEKRREVFALDEVEADLDELPYGWFLELEGPAQAIRALAARLGLDPADGLTSSYAEIFDNVRAGMKLAMVDLTFAAFEGIAVDPRFYTA
jgi:adenylate cyclase, class 2